jgi:hypothetical protein
MDPGPHQCDDFCPSHVANDERFDLQSQIVIKRYRCAAARLPVYRINENFNCLSFELFILVWARIRIWSLSVSLFIGEPPCFPGSFFAFSLSRYLQLMKAVKWR